jgi:serine protease Do
MKNTKMRNAFLALCALIMAGLASCASDSRSSGLGLLPPATLNLVQNAVFEVVWEKPVEDPVVYEKKLNWDTVPFRIRNDKYYSIGTAFAISQTELITAFHVINLGFESMIFNKYSIRDAKGNVYEVDQITGGSNEKDYLIFTVKGKTFDQYFQFEKNFKTGDPVFSIGNALGEGVVVRNGLILGTVPEEDSGRWNLLKSSADGNPGNSGGPLVTPDGKVVAVVRALRENILYSVPAEVVLGGSRSELPYRLKSRVGHLLLPSHRLNSTLEFQAKLPASYTEVRKSLCGEYNVFYNKSMEALFKEAPEYLTGPNNAYLLNSSLSSIFPEVSFVDNNDSNWKLSGLERKSYQLDDDGRLYHASVDEIDFYKIKRPLSVPIEKICTDPKYIMDLILGNIRTDRALWGSDKYRILSYGDPSSVGSFQDGLGRTWISALWTIGFEDEVIIMYILPLPNGPAIVSTKQDSSSLHVYEWDLHKTCDHLFAAYSGSLEEWTNFIALKRFIPDFLKDIRFNWRSGEQSFSFSSGPFSFNADKQVFDWNARSEMFLAPSWYKINGKLEFGIRRIILNGDQRGKEYVHYYRHIKPDPKLGTNAMENWNDLVAAKPPFDEKAVLVPKDNNGFVGAILKPRRANPDVLFTLYLSMESPQSEDNLNRRFGALKTGVSAEY